MDNWRFVAGLGGWEVDVGEGEREKKKKKKKEKKEGGSEKRASRQSPLRCACPVSTWVG
jgi:hypothetical protein